MTLPPPQIVVYRSLGVLSALFLCLLLVRVAAVVDEDLARAVPFAFLALVATHFVLKKVRKK